MRAFRLQTAFWALSVLTLIAFCFSGSPTARAQGIITGGITGTVTDQTGAVVAGATVRAVNESTGAMFQAVSNGEGSFLISALPLGSYKVTVSASGFSQSTTNHVTVVAGNATPLKIPLNLGAASQTVEVEGSASELINTESAQVEATVSAEQIATAPVTGALDNLALMVPGVVNTHADANSNTNGVNYSVNGQRGRSNNSEIDGQTNNDTSIGGPSFFFSNQDAIQEVQVVTTDMGAQYGRNMGAIVNYITKSGSNQFHGTAFEAYTGSWLSSLTQGQKAPQDGFCPPGQASNCLNNTSSAFYGDPLPVVPKFVQNNWGGTLGGPIWRNKAWFFGSTFWNHNYEGGQVLTSEGGLFPDATGMATLKSTFGSNPAVAAIAANGPYSTSVGNPTSLPVGASGGETPGQICAGLSGTLTASGYCDVPVTDGTNVAMVEMGQFERTFPDIILDQEELGRLDFNLTEKDKFYLRYNYQNNPYNPAFYLTAPNVAAAGAYPNVNGVSYETGADWTHTFTLNLFNQLRYAFQQSNIGFFGGGIPTCTISDQDTCSSFVGLGGSLASYGYDFAGAFPQGRVIKVNQVQDNASWTKGKHTILFGTEFDYQDSPWGWLPNDEGSFNFAPLAAIDTNNPSGVPYNYPSSGACGAGGANCNNGLTGFLEGIGELSLAEGNPTIPFKENDLDLYVQDNFKVNPNLMLNLGLRYEFFGQAINMLHNETVARQTGSSPFWSTTLPLSATTVPSLPSDFRNIEPRIGFAYTPTFAPKMVIHGGYAINADPEFYTIFVDVALAAPAINAGSFACGDASETPLVTCVPGGGLTFATVQAADDHWLPTGPGVDPRVNPVQTVTNNLHNPMGETYSLGFQYQVTPNAVADVRYVGNHTYGNFQAFNSNPDILDVQSAFPGYGSGIPVCTTVTAGVPATGYGRPNCNYGPVETYGNGAFSLYDALQMSLTTRNYHGLSGVLSYTYSKTIDNTDDYSISVNNNGGGGQATPFAQDPLNTDVGERGQSGNSYPNIWGIQLTYNEPWFHEQRGILGRLLGGYTFNAFYQYNGGQPYNPFQNATTIQSTAVLSDIAGVQADPATNTPQNPAGFTPAQAAAINPTEASQGFTDLGYAAAFGASGRPVLSNPKAPLNSIGINLGPGGYVDYVTGAPVARSSEHWIWSNEYEAIALGNPFPGVGRNILRGDSWNDLDMSAAKTFKIAERANFQIMASVFNVMNRGYYGTPSLEVESALNGTFESTLFTGSQESGAGNGAYPQGLGNRNVQLTGKIIF